MGILILGAMLLIVLGAARIIIGWVLPNDTIAAIDRFAGKAMKIYLQILVVAFAALIVWAFIAPKP